MRNKLGWLSAEREIEVLKQIYDAEDHKLAYHEIKMPYTNITRHMLVVGSANNDVIILLLHDLIKYGLIEYKFENNQNYYYLTDQGIEFSQNIDTLRKWL